MYLAYLYMFIPKNRMSVYTLILHGAQFINFKSRLLTQNGDAVEPVSLRIAENPLLSSSVRPSSSPGLFLTKREREEERLYRLSPPLYPGDNRDRRRLSSGGLLPRGNRKKRLRQANSLMMEGT